MRHRERGFGAVLMLAVLLDVFLTTLYVRIGIGFLRHKLARLPATLHGKEDVHAAPVRPSLRRDAAADPVSEADCHACAREAAAAIEAVLERQCPDLREAFWSAVDKHYRLGTEPSRRLPAG